MPTIAQLAGLQEMGPQPKKKRWKSQKYRDAARGQNCTMRLPGCKNDTETVVLCHRNGAGMAMKSDDHDGADACLHCHDILDGKKKHLGMTRKELMARFEAGRLETIINRIERGILK